MSAISNLSRSTKIAIATEIVAVLKARPKSPAEPALDSFATEFGSLVDNLSGTVDDHNEAQASWQAFFVASEQAEDLVTCHLRHIESFLATEALRHSGGNAESCDALHHAAFPDGLLPAKHCIPEENQYCRTALGVLSSSANSDLLKAIGFPKTWLSEFGDALDAADAAYADLAGARQSKGASITSQKVTEVDLNDALSRYRAYLGTRASRNDTAKMAESATYGAPLANALNKMRAESKARATRRHHHEPTDSVPAPPVQPAPSNGSALAAKK